MASEACCSAGNPVTVDYEPVGTIQKLDDLDVYITGSGTSAVIVTYDIFGFNYKQVFQVCDRLAESGLLVACADTFRGQAWTLARFPPKPEDNFMGWISTEGAWDKVSKDIYKVVDHLKTNKGVVKFGSLGFCWGATIAMSCGSNPAFSAVGCVHPAFFGKDKEFAEKNQAPVCMLPAKGDPMELLKEVFDTRPWGGKCVYQRFDDQTHGFCAARGDWSKPEIAGGATKAIEILSDFYKGLLL